MPAESRKVSDCATGAYLIEKCIDERPRAFADSNVLLYLISEDAEKAAKAGSILRLRCLVSVQVLNEMTNVVRRKHQYTWPQVEQLLQWVRNVCPIEPLTEKTHDTARRIAERYKLQFYDSLIVASALLAGCNMLYSEDMQHGLVVESKLRVVDPFL